jgi:hypothetical protein
VLRPLAVNSGQSAVALLVSNNSYRLQRAIGSGARPRLDKGGRGIAARLEATAANTTRRRVHPDRFGWERTILCRFSIIAAVACSLSAFARRSGSASALGCLPNAISAT